MWLQTSNCKEASIETGRRKILLENIEERESSEKKMIITQREDPFI